MRRVVVLTLLLSAFAGCQSPTVPPAGSTPAAAAPVVAPAWTEVASWRGSGMKETERFTTLSREWRVTWRSSNEAMPGAGILQVYVYRASDGALVTLAANKQGPGGDTSYVRTPPGEHYLTINAGNIDWSVTVEDQR